MDHHDKTEFKQRLKQYCIQLIERRMEVAKEAVENAREIANQEEKSTVGDKYETARAMGQLEQDMFARQLAENLKELATLQSVDVGQLYTEVVPGAFLWCKEISFFIAAGLGKHLVENKAVFFLSPHAPIAKSLWHKKAGDRFVFNGKESIIEEIF